MVAKHAPGDKKAEKVLLAETPEGKEIYLVRKSNATIRFIEFGSGGKLPKELEGGFSSVAVATQTAEKYVDKLAKEAGIKEEKVKGRSTRKTTK